MVRRLTGPQECFAQGVASGLSASDAYRAAYHASRMAPSTINRKASELANHGMITARVAELRRAAEPIIRARVGVTLADVVAELSHVAFARIDQVAPWTAAGPVLVPIDEVPEEVLAGVESIRVRRRREVTGSGENVRLWEVEDWSVVMHDKVSALDKLLRHLGGYPKPVEVNLSQTNVYGTAMEALSIEQLEALVRIADAFEAEDQMLEALP